MGLLTELRSSHARSEQMAKSPPTQSCVFGHLHRVARSVQMQFFIYARLGLSQIRGLGFIFLPGPASRLDSD